MTTKSCKAKSRNLQNPVASDLLRTIYLPAGLKPDDCRPIQMGAPGSDIVLSPAAREYLPLDIECKNRESLNVVSAFWEHHKKHAEDPASWKILVSKRNRTDSLATITWADMLLLLKGYVNR